MPFKKYFGASALFCAIGSLMLGLAAKADTTIIESPAVIEPIPTVIEERVVAPSAIIRTEEKPLEVIRETKVVTPPAVAEQSTVLQPASVIVPTGTTVTTESVTLPAPVAEPDTVVEKRTLTLTKEPAASTVSSTSIDMKLGPAPLFTSAY